MEKELSFSEKVIIGLRREKKTKVWLCDQLNITRPTLDSRLKSEKWLLCEAKKIEKLLNFR